VCNIPLKPRPRKTQFVRAAQGRLRPEPALPSVAQGNRPGAGAGANKGFPNIADKTGGGQLAGKVQGAQGGQLAGKIQGSQLGAVAGGAIGGGLANIGGGDLGGEAILGGRFQGGRRGGSSGTIIHPEQSQAIANRSTRNGTITRTT
jgi:hypothetical protein